MEDPDIRRLPPIARAEALHRPYRPGSRLRRVLIGAVVVSTLLSVFLLRMRDAAPRIPAKGPVAAPAQTPGLVFPKLAPLSPAAEPAP
jgi:hypothetical protein